MVKSILILTLIAAVILIVVFLLGWLIGAALGRAGEQDKIIRNSAGRPWEPKL